MYLMKIERETAAVKVRVAADITSWSLDKTKIKSHPTQYWNFES